MSLTVPDITEECKKPAPWTLPLFNAPSSETFPGSLGIVPGLNLDLRTPAVPPRRHMALLGKDSSVLRSAQKTPTQISVYPSIHTHTAATKLRRR